MSFKKWAKDTTLRAVKTAAQSLVALFTADAANWLNVDPLLAGKVALLAAVYSVLQNLANLKVEDDPTPFSPDIDVRI